MDRRTRICIWIIILGLLNFLAFVMMYIVIRGDAQNGRVERMGNRKYFLIQLRGAEADAARQFKPPPFIPASGPDPRQPLVQIPGTRIFKSWDGTPYKEISEGLYIYSAIHGISIWITIAAVLPAMLTLAKDQLVTAMEHTLITGRLLIHVFATVVVFATLAMTILFLIDFIKYLRV